MAFAEQHPCPDCGYLLHPLDNACPRCAKLRAQGNAPTAQVPPPPAYRPAPGSAQLQAISRDRYRQPAVPPVAIVLSVLIGLGAFGSLFNITRFSSPQFTAYAIAQALAAAGVIYGLCKLEPWARAATFIYLIANFVIGVPLSAQFVLQSSRQADAKLEQQMLSNGVRVEHSAPGTTTYTVPINPGTQPGQAAPTTPGTTPAPTTTSPAPTPTSPPGQVTITTHGKPDGLGLAGGMTAMIGFSLLCIFAFFRLILDVIFIVLLCKREVREVYA